MTDVWVAALSFISAAISSGLTFLFGRRKMRADTAQAITLAAQQVMDMAVKQYQSAERRIIQLEAELLAVRARVRDIEVSNAANMNMMLSVATRATEQVARLSTLREAEREQLTRELSRLRVMAMGTEEIPLAPWRGRERFNGGGG